jgi:hypothetical protein
MKGGTSSVVGIPIMAQPDKTKNTLVLCSVFINPSKVEAEANARLMAAAPELLKALKIAEIALVNCFPINPYRGDGPLVAIRAAMAKAEGK